MLPAQVFENGLDGGNMLGWSGMRNGAKGADDLGLQTEAEVRANSRRQWDERLLQKAKRYGWQWVIVCHVDWG